MIKIVVEVVVGAGVVVLVSVEMVMMVITELLCLLWY